MKTMTKRIFAVLLASLLLLGLMACAKDEAPVGDDPATQTQTSDTTATPQDTEATTPPADEDDEPTTPPADDENNKENNEPPAPVAKTTLILNQNAQGVAILGVRGVASADGIWCDWAGSGFEFNVDLPQAGDIGFMLNTTGNCCFRVFVDGTAHNNTDGTPYYKVNADALAMNVKNVAAGKHLISVVRCDDGSAGTALFNKAVIAGTHVTTLAEKDLYVEFVGDDITLGKGLNGTADGYDAALGFAYKTAVALNAEYSITALAGQGVMTGDYAFGSSYDYASPKHQADAKYGFEKKADIVVVALGTNDALADNTENFQKKYFELLYTIRQRNGEDCKIYCVYSGSEGLSAEVVAACQSTGGEAAGFYAVEWTGVTGTSYPTAQQQADFATALTARINATKDNEITAQPMFSGSGVVIDWKQGLVAAA